MADIFLSYTEKDRDTVRRLADVLQSFGWSVWWDRRIPAGLTWRSVLEQELQSMRCMVVLWSSNSVHSEWVCEEAAEGRRLGRLVPVSIDPVRPPAGFREVQAADLVGWDGSREFVGLQRLVEDIERLIGKPGAAQPTTPRHDPNRAAVDTPGAEIGHGRDSTPAVADAAARNSAVPAPASSARKLVPWGAATLVLFAVGAYFAAAGPKPGERPSQVDVYKGLRPPPTAAAPPNIASAAVAAVAPDGQVAAGAAGASGAPVPAATKPVVTAPLTAGPAVKAAEPPKRPGAKSVAVSSSVGARCAALRERLELGETLSSESKLFLSQDCQP